MIRRNVNPDTDDVETLTICDVCGEEGHDAPAAAHDADGELVRRLASVPGERFTLGGKRKDAPIDYSGYWSHAAFVPTHPTRPIRVDGVPYCDSCGARLVPTPDGAS